jgi:hypothetical protein
MAETIRVAVLKADGNKLEVNETFEQSLSNMQKVVGGYIEALTMHSDNYRQVTIWLNEEGKFNGSLPNFAIMHEDRLVDIVMGDVIITSSDAQGNTVGLNDAELEIVKSRFFFTKGLVGNTLINKYIEM